MVKPLPKHAVNQTLIKLIGAIKTAQIELGFFACRIEAGKAFIQSSLDKSTQDRVL